MKRERVDFARFESDYFPYTDCWLPVWVANDMDDNDSHLNIVVMDLVCPWRLTDGVYQFIEVIHSSSKELLMISSWIAVCVDAFTKRQKARIEALAHLETPRT